ncbi:hypothetical protein MNBD_CHLOROFLEXI01-1341 [hydrothermal vent metagenome]|uniref:Protein-glutamine gamma-glutamyltransferase-like C-terminal domain-containing protein n=1 Tax=hydrothermal vent metagenome TaxID=652676 RepID=A0A3B0VKL7_9ZZZZ
MRLTIDHTTLSPRYQALMTAWGHLQHELLYVTWAIMDAALLTPFLMSLMGWARYWQPEIVLLWLVVLMLFAFNLTRLMSGVRLPVQHQQTVMAVTLFLIIIVTLPTFFHGGSPIFRFGWVAEFMQAVNETGNNLWLQDVIVFGAIVLVWSRGLKLGRREYSISRAGLRLRVGGLLIAPMVVWLANTRLLWDSSPYILLFFLAGVTAVALIRAEEIEKGHSGQTLALDPRWLTAVLLASLLIIFLAGAVAIIVSGQSATGIIGWLAPAWISLRFIGTVTAATLLYLLIPFLQLIDILTTWIGNGLDVLVPWFTAKWAFFGKIIGKFFIDRRVLLSVNENSLIAPFLENRFIFEEVKGLGFQLSRSAQIIIILIAIALILLVVLVINRLYQQTAVIVQQSRSVQSQDDALEDEGLLRRLLKRLGILRNWQTAVSIRRLYRKMLRAADGSGYPRLDAETPYEFLKTLRKTWPENGQETELITTAYVKIRYGELPETVQELEAIKAAWRTLEQTQPAELIDD